MSLEIGPRTGDPMPTEGQAGGAGGGRAEDLTPAPWRWVTEPGSLAEGTGKILLTRKPDSA